MLRIYIYIYHLDPHYAFLFNTDQLFCSFMLLVYAAIGIRTPKLFGKSHLDETN